PISTIWTRVIRIDYAAPTRSKVSINVDPDPRSLLKFDLPLAKTGDVQWPGDKFINAALNGPHHALLARINKNLDHGDPRKHRVSTRTNIPDEVRTETALRAATYDDKIRSE
ncbi:MAG: hypothetical protein AAF619_12525, partial [Pseudomonadota bacterium]